jgi:hypothetical protein
MVHLISITMLVITFFLAGFKISELMTKLIVKIGSSDKWYKTLAYSVLLLVSLLYLTLMFTAAIDVVFFNR